MSLISLPSPIAPVLAEASHGANTTAFEISPWAWAATIAVVIALIAYELFTHRDHKPETVREATIASIVWMGIGLAVTLPIWFFGNGTEAGQYLSAYLLERSLSIDNVFVFVVILSYFAVPARLQHFALMWGIVAALVLRVIFILAGAALISRFEWTLAVFGLILVITAFKLATSGDEEVDPSKNFGLKLLRRFMPVSQTFQETKLFSTETVNGKVRRVATPMLAVLLVIGTTDLIFAVDSVPAVYGITSTPFLVFAANAFSLLGLRSLATLLAGVMDRFVYLKPALALVLAMIGVKMIVGVVTGWHPPEWAPLVLIVGIIGGGILLSFLKTRDQPHTHPSPLQQDEPRADVTRNVETASTFQEDKAQENRIQQDKLSEQAHDK